MTFDWRAYAAECGIPPMHAWIAVQKAFRASVPGGQVTSPRSLDRLCEDDGMTDVIRGAIEDATKGRS